jgi:hypothetical protein
MSETIKQSPEIVLAIANTTIRKSLKGVLSKTGIPVDYILTPNNTTEVREIFQNKENNVKAIISSLALFGFSDTEDKESGVDLLNSVIKIREGVEAVVFTATHPETRREIPADGFNVIDSGESFQGDLVANIRNLLVTHLPIFAASHGITEKKEAA